MSKYIYQQNSAFFTDSLQSVHDLVKSGGNYEKFLSYSLCVLSNILYQISFCGQNNLDFYEQINSTFLLHFALCPFSWTENYHTE